MKTVKLKIALMIVFALILMILMIVYSKAIASAISPIAEFMVKLLL